MDFKEFADQMEQDVRAALEDVSPGVTIRQEQISKLQGESYAALSVTYNKKYDKVFRSR